MSRSCYITLTTTLSSRGSRHDRRVRLTSHRGAAPAGLIVGAPLGEALSRGLVVTQYRADNLPIIPVFGRGALGVTPRIGHVHVALDDARWDWVAATSELIIQGLAPGPHRVLIEIADPTHRVIDSKTVSFEIPS
jgi:hypothetical protein